jgi:DNA-binding transcriptional MerR regulator
VSDDLLAIGAFSRATSLSVKTLRAYHELGILVPASVDPRTGYRSYTSAQLADAVVVVRLRALDVPLPHVREILDAHDPDVTRRVLAQHRERMQDRLAETERIVAELTGGLAASTHTPVHVRAEPGEQTVRIVGDVTMDAIGGWLERAYLRLMDVLQLAGVVPAGASAALYEAEIPDDDGERVEAYFPIGSPFVIPDGCRDVSLGEVPAATVAVLMHHGAFTTIGDTYQALGAWVARHAEPTGERVRERYLVGPDRSPDPESWRTEIAWPITPA